MEKKVTKERTIDEVVTEFNQRKFPIIKYEFSSLDPDYSEIQIDKHKFRMRNKKPNKYYDKYLCINHVDIRRVVKESDKHCQVSISVVKD